ncbi:MAG: MOFRL family protein, partial [Candidatus Eisenbacteria bacterium]|nr:MOFRL family protein [Candidatus Eisenbacteria bacterium]
ASDVYKRQASTGRPLCLLWGGETTVTVHGDGRGGRNHEIALAAALALDGLPACGVASFATDGVDGTSGAAGAYATGETVARAREVGLDPEESLARNDSGGFFAALGTQIVTGPTGTNVADVTIGLVYP